MGNTASSILGALSSTQGNKNVRRGAASPMKWACQNIWLWLSYNERRVGMREHSDPRQTRRVCQSHLPGLDASQIDSGSVTSTAGVVITGSFQRASHRYVLQRTGRQLPADARAYSSYALPSRACRKPGRRLALTGILNVADVPIIWQAATCLDVPEFYPYTVLAKASRATCRSRARRSVETGLGAGSVSSACSPYSVLSACGVSFFLAASCCSVFSRVSGDMS